MLSAHTRVENLRKQGVRVVSKERVEAHLAELEEALDKPTMEMVNRAVERILAECMVLMGNEEGFAARRYSELKVAYNTLLV